MNTLKAATLNTERDLFSSGVLCIAGMDEVGRGSLAGPVSVGVAAITAHHVLEIEGLIDSKALSEKRRLAMAPQVQAWAKTAVGHTQPAEIDALGMTRALRLAGQRALAQVSQQKCSPDLVLLDGKHDWLTAPEPDLLGELDSAEALYHLLVAQAWSSSTQGKEPWQGRTVTMIKGDYLCASIAAASVLAKVERDALMIELDQEFPDYRWAKNKGYGARAHQEALARIGASVHHRLSWNLGISDEAKKQAYLRRAGANQ